MSVTRDDRPTVERRSNVKDTLSIQDHDKPVAAAKRPAAKTQNHTHVFGGLGDYIPKDRAKDAVKQLFANNGESAATATKVSDSLQKFFKFLYRLFLFFAVLFSLAVGANAGIWTGIGTLLAMAIPATIMYGFMKFLAAGIGVAVETAMKGQQGYTYGEFDKKAKAYKDLNQ